MLLARLGTEQAPVEVTIRQGNAELASIPESDVLRAVPHDLPALEEAQDQLCTNRLPVDRSRPNRREEVEGNRDVLRSIIITVYGCLGGPDSEQIAGYRFSDRQQFELHRIENLARFDEQP